MFIWVCAALLGGIYEMEWMGGSTAPSRLNALLFYQISSSESSTGMLQTAGSPLKYLQNMWEMATFQYSFISGEAEIVRWILFIPLVAYVVFGILMTFWSLFRGSI